MQLDLFERQPAYDLLKDRLDEAIRTYFAMWSVTDDPVTLEKLVEKASARLKLDARGW